MSWRRAAIAVMGLGVSFMAQGQGKGLAGKTASATAAASVDAEMYRNPSYAFRYQIPYGWVDRTREMVQAEEAGKGELLLAIFERPPQAAGGTVNSAVVIAAENAAAYPGLKTAEDYVGPLTQLATAKGFKAEGEPYGLEVESRWLVRADFVKTIGGRLTMRQCTLVLLEKGKIVSFTFIASGEDELDELMDGLHFGAREPAPPRRR